MICERKRGGREATSGFRVSYKWIWRNQQVERAGATSGNRMSNRWRIVLQQVEMEILQQVGPASQIDEFSQIA